MQLKQSIKKVWDFLKADTWQSWLVSIILVIVIIKFIFFPFLSIVTGTSLPLVVVESCSMYHDTNFESWWTQNSAWYESHNITKSEFENYTLSDGLNKGDIVIVSGNKNYKVGDIIIYSSPVTPDPIIHRIVSINPLGTKGDNGNTNPGQIIVNENGTLVNIESGINPTKVIGKAVMKIPALGWVKLIFYEPLRTPDQKGFCH